jgi:hypothetical protein
LELRQEPLPSVVFTIEGAGVGQQGVALGQLQDLIDVLSPGRPNIKGGRPLRTFRKRNSKEKAKGT